LPLEARVTFTASAPNVYPLPPDGKSFGYLRAYNLAGELVQNVVWSFGDGDHLDCDLKSDGRFRAGPMKTGKVEVKGCCGSSCIKKTIEIACRGEDCPTCQQAASGTFELDSISMRFELGKIGRSGSAGTLTIKADAPSAALFTPARLDLGILNENVEVMRDCATGHLRQVYNPAQALVDIVPNGAYEYSLSFYRPSQVGSRVPEDPDVPPRLVAAGQRDERLHLSAGKGPHGV
jgi:hypothetical protein